MSEDRNDRDVTANPSFDIEAADTGEGVTIAVRGFGHTKVYILKATDQADFAGFYAALADDFGTRPLVKTPKLPPDAPEPPWQPLLTENLSETIHAGYGDPARVAIEGGSAGGLLMGAVANMASVQIPASETRSDGLGYTYRIVWKLPSRVN